MEKNNRVHNLKIEDLLDKLEELYEMGYSHVDAIFYTDYDLAFRPSTLQEADDQNSSPPEVEPKALGDLDLSELA